MEILWKLENGSHEVVGVCTTFILNAWKTVLQILHFIYCPKRKTQTLEGLRPPPLDWPSRARECGNARWLGSSDCQLVYTVTQSEGRGLGISGKRLRLMAWVCDSGGGRRRLGTGPMSVQVVSETWFPCSDLSFTPCRCTKNKIGDWLVDRGNLERDLASTATCVYAPAAVFAAPASISQLMHLRAVHFTTLSDPTISFQIFTNFHSTHFTSVICTKR